MKIRIMECGPEMPEKNRMLHDPCVFEKGQRNDKEYNEMLKSTLDACKKFARNAEDVLEIGAGTGLFSELLVPAFKNKRIVISEPDSTYIKIAAKKFAGNNNVRYMRSMAEYIKTDIKFDLIAGTECYHHIPDETKNKFFRNMRSLLKNNGFLALGDNFIPLYRNERERIKSLHKFWDPYIEAKRRAKDWDGVKSFSDAMKQAEEGRVEFKTSTEIFERYARNNGFEFVMKKILTKNIDKKGGYAVYVLKKIAEQTYAE